MSIKDLLGNLFRGRRARGYLLRQLPAGSIGAEIGVFRGDFSAEILRVVRPRQLHLIDPWKFETDDIYRESWYGGEQGGGQARLDSIHDDVRRRFAAEIAAGVVRIHRSASAEASGEFADGSLDWVYIDGNHLYEFVREDLRLYAPKVKRGGLITGDDYGAGGWWKGGVKRAVDEFVAGGAAERAFVRGGQFCLRKR
jgi:methyltransferase family protein